MAQPEEVQIPADVGVRLIGEFPVEALDEDLDEFLGGGEPWPGQGGPAEPVALQGDFGGGQCETGTGPRIGGLGRVEQARSAFPATADPQLPCSSDEFVERYGRTKGTCGVRHGRKSSNQKNYPQENYLRSGAWKM